MSLTRMEQKIPLTKQMANHLSLVLKLRDEASRACRDSCHRHRRREVLQHM